MMWWEDLDSFLVPQAIRAPDLRRVKTEVSELFTAFSLGEITTRNASAPS